MKLLNLMLVVALAALLYTCRTPGETARIQENNTNETDTLEYELVIFDPDYERWFPRNARPISFYDADYLASWNARLVTQWNTAPMAGRASCRPTTYLDYNTSIDYGKEFNYQLFNYFRYMYERCGIFTSRPGEWGRR
jgi:hypothetical protein